MWYMPLRLRAGARIPSAGKFSAAFGVALRLGDPLLLISGAFAAHLVRFGSLGLPLEYGRLVAITLLFALLVLSASPLYRSWRGRGLFAEALQIFLQWSIVFTALVLYATAIQVTDNVSRLWLGAWYGLSLASVIGLRMLVRAAAAWVRLHGMDLRSAVVVGANPDAQRIVDSLHQNAWAGIDLRGWFATSSDRSMMTGLASLGSLDTLGAYVDSHGIDQVWIALPMREQSAIAQSLDQLQHSTADIKFVPDLFGMHLLNHSVEQV
ncbi:MAG TPA: undecaprenyl-phosphate glucose phosphotransferase, partial [Stenotrophomonas sp.]